MNTKLLVNGKLVKGKGEEQDVLNPATGKVITQVNEASEEQITAAVGLSLLLVYGTRDGWVGNWFAEQGIRIIFSTPGMILATMFVSLPFVVREVQPVLREIGTEQEQAAATLGASGWQTFWRVTLPSIRWALSYGVVLATARALGEFGAVSVVSGKIQGQTETATLFVEDRFHQFDLTGAYAASFVLALLAIGTLLSMNILNRRQRGT